MLVELHYPLQKLQLIDCSLVLRVHFECFLELVDSIFVVSDCAHYKAPDDPVLNLVWLKLDGLLDEFACFGHVTFLEQGECPVPMTCMVYFFIFDLFLRLRYDWHSAFGRFYLST